MVYWQVASVVWAVLLYTLWFILPCVLVWRCMGLGTGVLLGWFLCIAGYAVGAWLLQSLAVAYDKSLVDLFPDGPSIFAALLVGWLPPLLLCGFAAALKHALRRDRNNADRCG